MTREDVINEIKKNEKFKMIAKWIYSECDTPISEIEWLLREYCKVYTDEGKVEEDIEILENEYVAVFELKKEKEK